MLHHDDQVHARGAGPTLSGRINMRQLEWGREEIEEKKKRN